MDIYKAVLDFWFGDNLDDLVVIKNFGRIWFGKDNQVDQDINQRFGALIGRVAAESIPEGTLDPKQTLAKVILLDQFTRNIYRGSPAAFAADPQALQLGEKLLAQGGDLALRPVERVFLYLPFEHSEKLEHQDQSVRLYQELAESVPPEWQESFAGFLDYAIRHRDIIVQFGRFPHRNALLGRASSAVEIDFLQQPGSSF